ncbi:MAG: ABC transporter ATP-binding protein [Candidatus Gracilibacteria bacterium]|nr:ABC transporter ATP-binding protein [Candidatus Gracilibacteria bacterium]
MTNIDRTFWAVTKKFLWPIQFRKIAYLKYLFQSILVGINLVIHVLFLERVSNAIENIDRIQFNNYLLYYFIYIFTFELINFSIKKWGWMNVLPHGIADIYNKYLNKYIKLSNNDVELIGTGKIIGIIQNGASTWAELLADFLEKGTALVVSILFTVYMVSRVEWYYGLLFIFLVIIFFYTSKKANAKLSIFRKERYELRNTRLRYLVKILMSKMEVLQTGRINSEMIGIYENAEGISYISKEMSTYRIIMKRSSQFGIAILILLSFWYLGNGVFDGKIKISILVGLTGTLIIMQKSISEFISFYVEFTKQFVNVEKLWDFFDTTPEIKGYDIGKTFTHKTGEIEIKNLTYGYTKDKPVFKDFNLKLSGEKVTALVGNSGSGKSTLIKLIAGYIRADSGDIIVDKQKLKDVSLKSYYKDIGYLTQEPSVFDGTVYDNLTYAVDRELKPGELDGVIKMSKCEFIYDLPKGVDTEIGERGIRLSGGQRQRLAIAKIFLKDPKIILLDEPTSALDSFSEEQITEAMHNLFKGRTIIVIAHRLQTVKHADDIILIENGRVKERGTHKELIKQKGIYKKMLDLQSGF